MLTLAGQRPRTGRIPRVRANAWQIVAREAHAAPLIRIPHVFARERRGSIGPGHLGAESMPSTIDERAIEKYAVAEDGATAKSQAKVEVAGGRGHANLKRSQCRDAARCE